MPFGQSIYSGMRHAALNKELYDGCCFRLYDSTSGSGIVYPEDPSKAVVGTLLARVTVSGGSTGITWVTPTDNVLYKNPSELWEEDSILANGTVTWLRLSAIDDDGTERTDLPRFDFKAGTYEQYESDINLNGFSLITARFSNTVLVAGQPFRINTARITSVLSIT